MSYVQVLNRHPEGSVTIPSPLRDAPYGAHLVPITGGKCSLASFELYCICFNLPGYLTTFFLTK